MYLSTFLTTVCKMFPVRPLLVGYWRNRENYLCSFIWSVLMFVFVVISKCSPQDFGLFVQIQFTAVACSFPFFCPLWIGMCHCVCVCVFSAGEEKKNSHCSIYWQWLGLCNSECMFEDAIYDSVCIVMENVLQVCCCWNGDLVYLIISASAACP